MNDSTSTLRLTNLASEPAVIRLCQDRCLLCKLHVDARGGFVELDEPQLDLQVIVEIQLPGTRQVSTGYNLCGDSARLLVVRTIDQQTERVEVRQERSGQGQGYILENTTTHPVTFHLRRPQHLFAVALRAGPLGILTYDPLAPYELTAFIDGIATSTFCLPSLQGYLEVREREEFSNRSHHIVRCR